MAYTQNAAVHKLFTYKTDDTHVTPVYFQTAAEDIIWTSIPAGLGMSTTADANLTKTLQRIYSAATDATSLKTVIGNATASTNGLMSSSDFTKLSSIAEGANKYVHPTYTSRSEGLYRITVDSLGHVSNATAVINDDISNLVTSLAKLTSIGASDTTTTIQGNLVVRGTTTTVNSQTLEVADNLITVAKGNTAALTNWAGIVVPKYDGTNTGALVYDSTGTAYVGDVTLGTDGQISDSSSLVPLLGRAASWALTDGHLLK
jgi:hypothetical protein